MSFQLFHNVNVLWLAKSNWLEGKGVRTHKHDYYHLFYIRKGNIRFEVAGKVRTIGEGEIALALPDSLHGFINEEPEIGSIYEVKFTTQSAPLAKQLATLPKFMPRSEFTDAMAEELLHESECQKLNTPDLLASYLLAMMNFCLRHYGQEEKEESSFVDTTGFSELSKKVVSYLEENSTREVSLLEVAANVGLNKNYLCTAFKNDAGLTIGACHTAIRIRKAAEMISFSDMDLAQIAEATGFCNPGHFNRIFKKVVGIPPGQYRKMYSNNMFTEKSEASMQDYARLAGQNGFIVAVLGRKKMSITDILYGLGKDE